MPTPLLIKENIPQPTLIQTNNACYNDASFTQIEYANTGINRWPGMNYIIDYMKLQKNIDLGENTLKNECTDISTNLLKTNSTPSPYIKLSNDNLNLMSACEFTPNNKFISINPLTKSQCLETMKNLDEPELNMSTLEKGYLLAFTVLVVGLLYKANYKLQY